jgi:ATP-dependent Clp protease protease subunit
MVKHLYIYGEIGRNITADSFRKELDTVRDASEIKIHIASEGGGVYQGWTIGNLISNSGIKSTAIIEGYCASIATYIALSCDTVTAIDPSHFMIHNPMGGIEGEAKDFRQAAEYLDKIKNDLVAKYQRKTGLNSEVLAKYMDDETTFSATEAKGLGFIDGFAESFKAVAKFDLNNKIKMEDKTEGLFKKIETVLKNLMKFNPKNMAIELADGGKIFVQTEDG